jgi:hypothetical protein
MSKRKAGETADHGPCTRAEDWAEMIQKFAEITNKLILNLHFTEHFKIAHCEEIPA